MPLRMCASASAIKCGAVQVPGTEATQLATGTVDLPVPDSPAQQAHDLRLGQLRMVGDPQQQGS